MKLSKIESGWFKLDGGAMFGVVPKTLWNRVNPADDNNMCTWTMRCLLIETGERKILVDTGMGNKQGEKFRSHFEPHGPHSLDGSLSARNLKPEDITDVFLTHLHFDHVGGAVMYNEDGDLVPTFPNATYWSNKDHYDWAYDPNERERASFLKENFVPLMEHSKLEFLNLDRGDKWIDGLGVHRVHGHTEAMMLLEIDHPKRKCYYCADLMPSAAHIKMPWVLSYDIRPLNTLREKDYLLKKALDEDAILIFEHDHQVECCNLTKDKRGRIVMDQALSIDSVFGD